MTSVEEGGLDMVGGKVAGSRGGAWHPAIRAATVALDAASSQGLRSKDWVLGVIVWSCSGPSIAYRPAQAEHTLCQYVPPGFATLSPTPLQGATPAAWQSQFRGVCWKDARISYGGM